MFNRDDPRLIYRVEYARRKYTLMAQSNGGCFTASSEPQNLHEAFTNKNWKDAMNAEYDALIKNETWHLVPLEKERNVIDYKWVYKIKRKADGSLDRYKTRLVAKVFKKRA